MGVFLVVNGNKSKIFIDTVFLLILLSRAGISHDLNFRKAPKVQQTKRFTGQKKQFFSLGDENFDKNLLNVFYFFE